MTEISLIPAALDDAPRITAMLHAYLDEMGLEAPRARASAPLYWQEEGRWPFLIASGTKTAGFALIRRTEAGMTELAEFSVLPAFRNGGIGARAAHLAFARIPGPWQLKAVPKAAGFWSRTLAAARFVVETRPGGWHLFTVPPLWAAPERPAAGKDSR